MFANIVINITSSNVDQTYQYLIPDDIAPFIQIGARVEVPFGEINRPTMGYVISLTNEKQTQATLKSITSLLDYAPYLKQKDIELATYIKEDTLCPLAKVLQCMLPDAYNLKTKQHLFVKSILTMDAKLAEKVVIGQEVPTSISQEFSSQIKKEIQNGNIELVRSLEEKTKEKKVPYYQVDLRKFSESIGELSKKAQESLYLMKDASPMSKSDVMDKAIMSDYMFTKLLNKKYFRTSWVKESRVKEKNVTTLEVDKQDFLPSAKEVLQKFHLNETLPFLFIPKSNQEMRQVLEQLTKEVLDSQKAILILVPNILMSYDVASFLRKVFHQKVACINSDLSKTEYYDLYEEILQNEYSIIVSTSRGALLPYPNLKTMVMLDIESDSYFNDQSPRYDLKKVMQKKSITDHIPLFFSSFSPRITDFCYAIRDKYVLCNHQATNLCSNVFVIDMKNELLEANNSPISLQLQKEIETNLDNLEITLLLINRKSYYTSMMCRNCGTIMKCPKCDIMLEYSDNKKMLLCPNCSYHIPMVEKCPTCGKNEFMFSGIGREGLTSELKKKYQTARVASLDDANYLEFATIMSDIEESKVDIIVTNEAYAKSFVSNKIKTVAIMQFDSLLKIPNYDANARAYGYLVGAKHLLEETKDSHLLIQAFDTKHFVIQDFITSDFSTFVQHELINRKALFYEPFCHVNRIFVQGSYEQIFVEANRIKYLLKDVYKNKIFVIGPTYNKKYQAVQIIFKYYQINITSTLQKIYENYQKQTVTVIFDRYPKYL
jgi:primosomal protein N' (replication factor Y)